jgi:hypothetical protein
MALASSNSSGFLNLLSSISVLLGVTSVLATAAGAALAIRPGRRRRRPRALHAAAKVRREPGRVTGRDHPDDSRRKSARVLAPQPCPGLETSPPRAHHSAGRRR